jgi:hypothetical protein
MMTPLIHAIFLAASHGLLFSLTLLKSYLVMLCKVGDKNVVRVCSMV